MTLNGLSDIYLMEPGAKVMLREIRCDREPDKVVADRLADAGFVRLTGENIDQKINAETYSLIELILKIFSATLLIMGGVAWITLILRQVIDSLRQLQALAGFGASPWEIATFLRYRMILICRRYTARESLKKSSLQMQDCRFILDYGFSIQWTVSDDLGGI